MLQIYMESFTQLTINHSSSQGFNTHYLCCVWQFVPLSRLINTPSKCLSKLFISWSLSANVAAVPQCVNQIHSALFSWRCSRLAQGFYSSPTLLQTKLNSTFYHPAYHSLACTSMTYQRSKGCIRHWYQAEIIIVDRKTLGSRVINYTILVEAFHTSLCI